MIKKTYHISGFDCPNCAHKSEAHLGKHEKVDSCHIDFSTNKMYVTYKDKELEVEEIKKVIAQVESDPLDIYNNGWVDVDLIWNEKNTDPDDLTGGSALYSLT